MSLPPEMSAEDVVNYTLDRTGEALDTGDFDLFHSVFHLPHRISTFEGTKILKTDADLREVFNDARMHRQFMGATGVIRYVVSAEYKTPTQVEGVHMTHVMAGELRIKEPYPTFAIVKWIDGAWKVVSSDYAIDTENPQSGVRINQSTLTRNPTHAGTRKNQ